MGFRRTLAVAAALATFAGSAALAAAPTGEALPTGWLPAMPYMSNSGANSMHSDGYGSNTHPWSGPVGHGSTVTFSGKGPCAGMGVTKEKLLLLQCGGATNFTMRLVDPVTLKDLASYNLPPRPSTLQAAESASLDKIYSDTSGAYFYLDNHDRAVVADAAQHVQRIAHVHTASGWAFKQVDDWDLSKYLPHDCTTYTNPFPKGACDPLTGVLPDFHGLLWWISRYGRVGTLNPATGEVHIDYLRGEEIENSHSVGEDGVFVVSDHAMYRFLARPDGTPYVVWRKTYDRGSQRKTGQVNQGSGTTPTLLGKDYVAITDNADPRMHVLVYRRSDGALHCSVPVFGANKSASENSLVGWDGGLLVENNFGYLNGGTRLQGADLPGGVTKVAVDSDGCHVAWTNPVLSPSVVPKLARGNGMLYLYSPTPAAGRVDAWYLTVVNWRTGRIVARIHTGDGLPFDNAWAPITLGPNGYAYVSCFGGLISVRDH
jgi:hypothetical protein